MTFGLLLPTVLVTVCNLRVLGIARYHRHRIASAIYEVTLSAQVTITHQRNPFFIPSVTSPSAGGPPKFHSAASTVRISTFQVERNSLKDRRQKNWSLQPSYKLVFFAGDAADRFGVFIVRAILWIHTVGSCRKRYWKSNPRPSSFRVYSSVSFGVLAARQFSALWIKIKNFAPFRAKLLAKKSYQIGIATGKLYQRSGFNSLRDFRSNTFQ